NRDLWSIGSECLDFRSRRSRRQISGLALGSVDRRVGSGRTELIRSVEIRCSRGSAPASSGCSRVRSTLHRSPCNLSLAWLRCSGFRLRRTSRRYRTGLLWYGSLRRRGSDEFLLDRCFHLTWHDKTLGRCGGFRSSLRSRFFAVLQIVEQLPSPLVALGGILLQRFHDQVAEERMQLGI